MCFPTVIEVVVLGADNSVFFVIRRHYVFHTVCPLTFFVFVFVFFDFLLVFLMDERVDSMLFTSPNLFCFLFPAFAFDHVD